MSISMKVWVALVLGALPLLGLLLWWWNELWYVLPLRLRHSPTGAKLPPGHMGLPFLGEIFTFLWYFKIVGRPNDFINAKRTTKRIWLYTRTRLGEFITYEDVSKMKYTNKVVEETIRLANVAAFVFRLATKEVEYKVYKIPKDWRVFVWVRYLHTNSENFDDPMCFNPDRWNESAKLVTYQVFGGGSRICAGNLLVKIQLAVFLHHLSIGFKKGNSI